MPRIIPRLARLSLTQPIYTSTPSTISAVRSLLSTSTPTFRALPSMPTSSRLLQPRTLSQTSIFTSSPRSTILSRLPTPLFQAHQTQIRTLTYGTTYQPSQRKRKRKYGFLARLKGGRLGQAILARRRIRGRRFLSH